MATASISTIGRAVGDRLQDGMTWKKIMRPAGEKCTRDNQVGYFNRVLRPSLREDQAGVIHAISPIWMKLCQIEGITKQL